jgi:hypothetical protein
MCFTERVNRTKNLNGSGTVSEVSSWTDKLRHVIESNYKWEGNGGGPTVVAEFVASGARNRKKAG